ncbi:SixA phosphatase family protein [Aestuariibius insulae]|uniref:SixA phosphatase family protein n=1 Tax=Aestuariibius insulae TaxID=2058287 RepID=UPI00346DA9BE
MKLILTRHAKSDWSGAMTGDEARPLSGRGRKSAAALGKWMAEHIGRIDRALVSSSTRTRQTWDLIAEHASDAPDPIYFDALYCASEQTILNTLREHGQGTTILIAHNPGIAHFSEALAATPPDHHDFLRYPTGATTVYEIEDWPTLAEGSAKVLDFVLPRDLLSDRGSG